MKIENQVCTLEQAKKLKELGVKQDSLFWYTQDKTPNNPNLNLYGWPQESMPVIIMFGQQSKISTSDVYVEYSAFTVAELGVMLQYVGVYSSVNSVLGNWAIHHVNGYADYELRQPGNFNNYQWEAEARAAILIELLEDKKITVEEVNQRLILENDQTI
jgi:hypothetical protein